MSPSEQTSNDRGSSDQPSSQRTGILRSIGPAIIVASVVLGPGSILSASKIGYQFGYQMTWVLAIAVLLMLGMTMLSARLGVVLDGTLCQELAKRAGAPFAMLAGVTLFLIAACFQFGNNLGVLAALEPFYEQGRVMPVVIIVVLNVLIIVALYGFSSLYRPVERLMKILVGLMLVGFAGNLLMARPDLLKLLAGLMPSLPEQATETLLPRWQEAVVEGGKEIQSGRIVDHLLPVTALFATTFSVGGAFYQSYLVRQKGWTMANLRQGAVDSGVGILILGAMTLMIMATSAAVLHGNAGVTMNSVSDVARQLEPAFGTGAKVLFCLGIFAGAFSSFMVNAMVGGSLLADGFGLGGYLGQRWPRLFTVVGLLVGMAVALYVHWTGQRPVNLIIFAQALTVLGLPVLAAAMLWLSTRKDLTGERAIPVWMKAVAWVSFVVVLSLALRTAVQLYLRLTH